MTPDWCPRATPRLYRFPALHSRTKSGDPATALWNLAQPTRLPDQGEGSGRSLCYNPITMALTLDQVRHIARLARLKLSEAEEHEYGEQLSDFLEHVDRLQAVDTENVASTATVVPVKVQLRADEARPGLTRDDVLANAPETEDGMFRVPPILD